MRDNKVDVPGALMKSVMYEDGIVLMIFVFVVVIIFFNLFDLSWSRFARDVFDFICFA